MANQPAQTQAPITVNLEGDVTLIIVNAQKPIHVQVSRALLSLVSQYFNTFFNGNFQEASAVAAGQACRIEEDNVNGLINLLKILHMRYDGPIPMHPRDILQLGIVADKYDCVSAINLTLSTLFPPCTAALSLWDARDVIVAAYLLDDPQIFGSSTREILMSQAGSFSDIAQTQVGERVPLNAWLKLESTRSKVLRDLRSVCSRLLRRPCAGPIRHCPMMTQWSLTMIDKLRDSGLDDVDGSTTIDQILNKSCELTIPDPPEVVYSKCPTLVNDFHPRPITNAYFHQHINVTREKCIG